MFLSFLTVVFYLQPTTNNFNKLEKPTRKGVVVSLYTVGIEISWLVQRWFVVETTRKGWGVIER